MWFLIWNGLLFPTSLQSCIPLFLSTRDPTWRGNLVTTVRATVMAALTTKHCCTLSCILYTQQQGTRAQGLLAVLNVNLKQNKLILLTWLFLTWFLNEHHLFSLSTLKPVHLEFYMLFCCLNEAILHLYSLASVKALLFVYQSHMNLIYSALVPVHIFPLGQVSLGCNASTPFVVVWEPLFKLFSANKKVLTTPKTWELSKKLPKKLSVQQHSS